SGCADVPRATALGALLDFELDLLTAVEAIEVERRSQAVAMEEVILPVLAGDEAEASIRNDLFDGSGGHNDLHVFSNDVLPAYGQFEKRSTTRELATVAMEPS